MTRFDVARTRKITGAIFKLCGEEAHLRAAQRGPGSLWASNTVSAATNLGYSRSRGTPWRGLRYPNIPANKNARIAAQAGIEGGTGPWEPHTPLKACPRAWCSCPHSGHQAVTVGGALTRRVSAI